MIVVGAAVVRASRLLVAQRSYPPVLAGLWELPGGKAQPGEDDASALVRECREELGVELAVGARVGPQLELPGGAVLRAYACTIVSGEPMPGEHQQLRWLAPEDLDDLPWLLADLPLVPHLVALLDG